MNQIGKVLLELRTSKNMSQKDLAKGICSEKYIYFIETGQRTPSAYVINELSLRLEVDLFEFFPYLDCRHPMEVYNYIEKFNFSKRHLDYRKLMEITTLAYQSEDFQKEPFCYELKINELLYQFFMKRQGKEVLEKAFAYIQDKNETNMEKFYYIRFQLLITVSYLSQKEFKNAKSMADEIFQSLNGLKYQKKYRLIIKESYICMILSEIYMDSFTTAIAHAKDFLEYQNQADAYEWEHFGYIILAVSYYRSGKVEEAIEWFSKGLRILIVHDKKFDVSLLRMFPDFDILLRHSKLNPELEKCFFKVYE